MTHIFNCTGHELTLPSIVKAQGSWLLDKDGKEYLDLCSGVWCTILGHTHDTVTRTLFQQSSQLMHAGFNFSNNVVEQAAQRLLEITDLRAGKCVFLCSGSEAIELSRQIVKWCTGKILSLTLHDSYLGSYSSTKERDRNWFIFNWSQCETCERQKTCEPTCSLLQAIPNNIGDFIFEPGSSSGHVRFPPKAMIQNLTAIVRKNGGKLIANEVTTGIGRTGRWFGCNHYDISPDLFAIGKGIGNGYPVSAVVMSGEVAKIASEEQFRYAQSHQNDPSGAAVALSVLESLTTENLIQQSKEKGDYFLAKLLHLAKSTPIKAVRGRGMMLAIELVDANCALACWEKLQANGFLVCRRDALFRLDPPLTTTYEEIDDFIGTFTNILFSIREKS